MMVSRPPIASPLLQANDGSAFEVSRPNAVSPIILVCEHASNRVPAQLENLGLTEDQLQSHVAWDPGALALSNSLSGALDATLVAARFSRLVYDCNRPPEAVSAMPSDTEACHVPGNVEIPAVDRLARTIEIYFPFHAELSRVIAAKRALGVRPIIATIHSFTPIFHGKPRDVEIGFLHGVDRRLASEMLSFTKTQSTYDVRLNEPYAPKDGVLHSIEKQLDDVSLPHVMIEVRNDLLAEPDRLADISNLLSQSLSEAVSSFDVHKSPETTGSAK